MTGKPLPVPDRIDLMARARLGGGADAIARLTGGASQELWSFAVAGSGYVLRRRPDDDRIDRPGRIPLAHEAAAIGAAGAAGVPVAAVAHVLDEDDALGEGFVAERMPGEALGRRIVADPAFDAVRPQLAAACGTVLARLHATPIEDLVMLPRRDPADAIASLDAQWRGDPEPAPMFAAALAWLERHCPTATEPRLVHGDFRTGNFLLTPDGISAVLDWESCHRGDPIADLGWLTMPVWRFGRLDRPVGGFGARADLYAAYEAETGSPLDYDRLRFWEIAGMLRWGLTCRAMAGAVMRGERSIERAAVGRRAAEAELELARALGA